MSTGCPSGPRFVIAEGTAAPSRAGRAARRGRRATRPRPAGSAGAVPGRASDRRAGGRGACMPTAARADDVGPPRVADEQRLAGRRPRAWRACARRSAGGACGRRPTPTTPRRRPVPVRPDLVDGLGEVPVPVRADGEAQAATAQLGQHLDATRRSARGPGSTCRRGASRRSARTRPGARRSRRASRASAAAATRRSGRGSASARRARRRRARPRTTTARDLGRQLVAVLGEHHVDRDPSGRVRQRPVEVEEDGGSHPVALQRVLDCGRWADNPIKSTVSVAESD